MGQRAISEREVCHFRGEEVFREKKWRRATFRERNKADQR